jgi:putative zinc finger protein
LRAVDSLIHSHTPWRGESTPECVDDETVAALAAGDLAPETRAAFVAHVASCAYCRGRVASVARALADPAVAFEIAAVEARGDRRVRTFLLLPIGVAAAAAVLLFAVLPRPGKEAQSTHRAPTITAAPAPVPDSPVGAVANAGQLRWASVAGADRYRVTLFDAGGRVMYETQLPDTVVALPDSLALLPGRPYLWKVEARTGWDRWVASPLVEFSVAARTP